MSSRPRANELARSGYVPMAEKGRRAKVDEPLPGEPGEGLGPVPEGNRAGHRPEHDQDKPVGPPPAPADPPADPAAAGEEEQ